MSDTGRIVIQEEILTDKKSKLKLLTWWRRLIQVAFLIIMGQWSFYGIFRCPFIVPYVSCQNCPVITCHGRLVTMFWGFWLLLPLSIILFGRAFCGWACPGGLINQLCGILSPLKLKVKNDFNRILPYFKYLALILSLYAYFIIGQPREAIPIRAGDFFNSVYLTFEHANMLWLIRTFIVLGFLVLCLLISNMWCRFACPAGGLLDLLKPISLFKVYKTEACDGCNKCLEICCMGTLPAESNCTNCCECLEACPRDAIKIGRP
ncbi:4Fe-4S binding protein [Thermodesulfobacteriota bacterium]